MSLFSVRRLVCSCLLGLVLAAPTLALDRDPTPYVVLSLDLPFDTRGLGFTAVDDLSDTGVLAGNFVIGPRAFLVQGLGEVSLLACPGATPDTTGVKSINRFGTTAGFCVVEGQLVGFVRLPTGFTSLLRVPGARFTEALGVSDLGTVVGHFRDSDGDFHGFEFRLGTFRPLDVPFPGAHDTSAQGINTQGQIVGTYLGGRSARFPDGQPLGFLFTRGTYERLDVPEAALTIPLDVNDLGQVVGIYADEDLVPASFLYANGTFRRFELDLPNVTFVDVSGLNNRGQIVGRYLESDPDDADMGAVSRGFVATPFRLGGTPAVGARVRSGPPLALALNSCPDDPREPGWVVPGKLRGQSLWCRQ